MTPVNRISSVNSHHVWHTIPSLHLHCASSNGNPPHVYSLFQELKPKSILPIPSGVPVRRPPTVFSDMFPSPSERSIRCLPLIDPWILPPVEYSVITNRADLDADPAGGDIAPVQFSAPGCTCILVCHACRVLLRLERTRGAMADAAHTPEAERLGDHRIRLECCGSEHGPEPDPRPVIRRQNHVVYTERPEAREICGMPVGEERDRIVQEHFDASIAIPWYEGGWVSLFVQVMRNAVCILIEKLVDRDVQLPIVDGGSSLQNGQGDGKPDDDHRFCPGQNRVREKFLRYPGSKGWSSPAIESDGTASG